MAALVSASVKHSITTLITSSHIKDRDDELLSVHAHFYTQLLGDHSITASSNLIIAQEEREYAINAFKSFQKDVLVATDVASKGLDFAEIHHVILFDMPKEIEDYVHRIGRTGRSGKTGIATTFINMNSSEQILLDLKHLLKEAKQRVPPVLEALEDPMEKYKDMGVGGGCGYCGGLGHRVTECPKLEQQQKTKNSGMMRPNERAGNEM